MQPKWWMALAAVALYALVPCAPSVSAQSRPSPAPPQPPVNVVENTFYVTQGVEVDDRLLPLDSFDIPAASLAPGVGLDQSGLLYGKPERPGTYTTPIKLCRGLVCVEERVTIIVHRNIPWQPGELTFPGQVGTALTGQIAINGGPSGVLPTFTVTNSTSLPQGMAIGPDGHVSGTPKVAGISDIPVRICLAGNCAGVVVRLIVV
ncbi:hypothetical protein ACIBG8_49680 [Nonomuraea sp. NPDC050556]|uniref:hypothetical protein n=1 Tax=Nonomuraea sp. NPDC050556 TaxID=3364369 RepID=UPI0037A54318